MNGHPPSTSDYVRFHALHRPGAIAVIDNGREIDYVTFHRDLGRFTQALREFDVPRGSFVAVAWESFYLHWLLLLACENLGWATASFRPAERAELSPLMARVQFVLCGLPVPQAGETKQRLLTHDWLDRVFGSPEAEEAAQLEPLAPGEPQRIRRSSGTTGGLKMMIGTRLVEDLRVEKNLMHMGFTPQTKLLLTTHFTVGSMYSRATACLQLGATCILDSRLKLSRSIERYRPSHIWLFEFQMNEVLGGVSSDFRRSNDLTLMMGSSPVSESLWRRIEDRLASRIIYTYNCNEAGTIASIDVEGVATLRPDVLAEIVDENGAPVPAGQIGRVRVKTRSMVDGYLDNPDATARSFRDGWFHTGDAGMMLGPGKLKLVGRSDELLNIAGLKLQPESIEERVRQIVPALDVGVTSLENAHGIAEMCVAFAIEDTAKAAEYCARIEERFRQNYGSTHVRAVEAIPRTPDTGRIRRNELKKLFAPG